MNTTASLALATAAFVGTHFLLSHPIAGVVLGLAIIWYHAPMVSPIS